MSEAHNAATDGAYLEKELYRLVRTDARYFEFLQEATIDGLWYWDLVQPENEWMSPKFWKMFGYEPHEKKHLASEWQSMIHEDDLPKAYATFEAHSKDPKKTYDNIVRYKHKRGHWVSVRCRGIIIRDHGNKPVRMLGSHVDVTNLVDAEKISHGDRQRAAFLSSISHELRTPLTSITGAAKLLIDSAVPLDSEQRTQMARIVVQNAERMIQLVNNLLDLESAENNKLSYMLTTASSSDLLTQCMVESEGLAAQYDIMLQLVHCDDVNIMVDGLRFQQVMANLISNAAKYSQPGGNVDIRAERQADLLRISVKDYGEGIPKAKLPMIFGRFQSKPDDANRRHYGTGIGLNLTKDMVENMKGEIAVFSVEHEWTEFVVTFPIKSS